MRVCQLYYIFCAILCNDCIQGLAFCLFLYQFYFSCFSLRSTLTTHNSCRIESKLLSTSTWWCSYLFEIMCSFRCLICFIACIFQLHWEHFHRGTIQIIYLITFVMCLFNVCSTDLAGVLPMVHEEYYYYKLTLRPDEESNDAFLLHIETSREYVCRRRGWTNYSK